MFGAVAALSPALVARRASKFCPATLPGCSGACWSIAVATVLATAESCSAAELQAVACWNLLSVVPLVVL